uniref:Uncharacterized protein n=1 Tax=uncultured bacterium A1Q1_fos_1880 TaxID=1256556 RepID=L7VZB7_9BACT|nr:hypothetical protein [uncultured bacterium A1Q1_fos_1880]
MTQLPNHSTSAHQPRRLSRRTFLYSLATALSGALLAACGPPRSNNRANVAFGPQATPPAALPSPVPATPPTAPTDELPLAQFLALSAVLTGVPTLNPELGRIYLQSLQASPDFTVTVPELYDQAGFRADAPPPTIAMLESTGLFTQEATRTLADRIIELWYTGVYTNAQGEATVATYVDALAWQTLAFTKPTTICGYPGFWSEAWEAVLD